MIELDYNDQSQLIQLLTPLPVLLNPDGRVSVLEAALLQKLIPLMHLSGPSVVVIPLMIRELRVYGRVTYEHEALGRFLNTMKNYVGVTEQEFLDKLILKYKLMTPSMHVPLAIDWMLSTQDVSEKIIGENTLRPIAFLARGLEVSRAVVYIEVTTGEKSWSGTGFLIAPDILMTNHHVLPDASLLQSVTFRFNYQHTFQGQEELTEDYSVSDQPDYIANSELDYAVVRLASNPGNKWGYLPLSTQVPPKGSRVNIVQHPNGLPKQISIQNNFVKFANTTKLQYVTSTMPGSSGSPVFNNKWEVVALHRAGGLLSEEENGPLYYRNEGATIQAIIQTLPQNVVKVISDLN
ncbi:MAG: trypsin-like peptidase domain-containing protein [Anaerolineaceae bacterium]|nr:trypsin-like peptidase domain-containing protein [Anaerolineaceae bacterium]